ncbi:zinc metalloprotease HtpX [Paludibaculum fermentans]|uniref:Protease HtpX homolog n=1 Tax=Paludibaculum fermentans TaxID=1473598 RepID=A0A7S7SGZ0_PALFE|nr:zinc metalloprotease HtpX [Paludibaculum fermentans]QOY85342.1 zinc metalloprotease HtpX [Paludibaculum fermentans]
MNGLKTALLLGLMSGVLLVGGQLLGGRSGLQIGLILAVGMNFFSYFFSEKMALMSSGAIPVSETQNQEVYWRLEPMVRRLTERMGLPMPRLWVIPEQAPNAFATGRNPSHSSVAVTAGLLELMNDTELEGVIAHELGHVRHRDILISSIAATLAAAITYSAHMAMFFGGRRSDDDDAPNPLVAILMMLLAPIAAGLIQMAISRSREYSADAAAAKYTGSPNGLISALGKLETWSKRIPMDVSPAMSHMYIIKPFTGQTLARLFSTHPATEERIARLEGLRAQ